MQYDLHPWAIAALTLWLAAFIFRCICWLETASSLRGGQGDFFWHLARRARYLISYV